MAWHRVLNALQGGIVDNSAIVPAGADGGIQVMATANCDLVIDLNGYYVQTGNLQGLRGRRVLRDHKGRSNGRARTAWSGGSGWAGGSTGARGGTGSGGAGGSARTARAGGSARTARAGRSRRAAGAACGI